jgi:hypothetical protein
MEVDQQMGKATTVLNEQEAEWGHRDRFDI